MRIPILLDSTGPEPMHRQLYDQLRAAILTGRLAPGERLPSSRELATFLGVSRSTTVVAFDQLLAEGYLATRKGAGTYVPAELPEVQLEANSAGSVAPNPTTTYPLSDYGQRLAETGALRVTAKAAPITFAHYGGPALDHFPVEVWRALTQRRLRDHDLPLGYESDARGYGPLRAAISEYVSRARAVTCHPDQIVIVGGSQQALDLAARLFVNTGDRVVIEEPGYLGARHVFASYGADLVPVPVDEAGLQVDRLPGAGVRLVHVTPSHQFPTGTVLSLSRRLALLDWAERTGALVLEDDYDSEFRYVERPIPALQGLGRHGRVLYIGTFSKVLFPALRLGYLVVPEALVGLVSRAKWLTDRQAPLLEQAVLADFISEGHMGRHVRRMRTLYASRRACLTQALARYMGDRVRLLGDQSGMHLLITLESGHSDGDVLARAEAEGVGLASAASYYAGPAPGGQFVLGYAHLTEAAIEEGIQRLARAVGGCHA
ncbi:MAG TPA: PLP-dependent aminotransferase family protein [Stenomitos sp.]